MNKMLMAVAVALALCGGPAYAETIDRWPTGANNIQGASEYTETGYGGPGGAGAVFRFVEVERVDKVSATFFVVSATALLDNKWVLPYTALGIEPTKVTRVLVQAQDGCGTNFVYIGWSMSQNGLGAAAGAFGTREVLHGAGGTGVGPLLVADGLRAQWDNPNLNNRSNQFGTIYASTGDVLAQGIQNVRVRIESRP